MAPANYGGEVTVPQGFPFHGGLLLGPRPPAAHACSFAFCPLAC